MMKRLLHFTVSALVLVAGALAVGLWNAGRQLTALVPDGHGAGRVAEAPIDRARVVADPPRDNVTTNSVPENNVAFAPEHPFDNELEVLDEQPIDIQAVSALLSDPDPAVREEAAALLDVVLTEEGAAGVVSSPDDFRLQ
jgi:hypothetical protein